MNTEPKITRASILDEAKKAVCTDRSLQYGEPEDSFAAIADLWSAYLTHRCVPKGVTVDVDARCVAEMMILFKVGRAANAIEAKPDTYTDIAGYAACAGEIACGGNADVTN